MESCRSGPPEHPFRIAPSTRFVYPGQLDEALAALSRAAVGGRDAAVLAEPGMGKTLLLRLLAQAREGAAEVRFAAAGPGFNPEPLLAPAAGPLLALIDEAQALSPSAARALSDRATALRADGAAVSLVFAGRPSFEPIAAEAELALEWHLLGALPIERAPQLVRRRLAAAGLSEEAFEEDALREIARRSRGVPRLLNLACANALFRAQGAQATMAHARAALNALELPEAPEAEPEEAPHALPGGGAALAARAAEPRRQSLGWRALASGLALLIGGLAGLGLLVAARQSGAPPAEAVATLAPSLAASDDAPAEPAADLVQVEGPVAALAAPAMPSPQPAEDAAALPRRLVLHYSTFDPRSARLARRLADRLSAGGLDGLELRPVRLRIDSTTVRYFFDDDLDAASRVRRELGLRGSPARVQDLTHYEPKPREGSIEIWLAQSGGAQERGLRRVRADASPTRLQPSGARDWP